MQFLPALEDLSNEETITAHVDGNAAHSAAKPPAVKIAGFSLRDRLPLERTGFAQPQEAIPAHLTERCFLDRKCATPIKYQSNYLSTYLSLI
jgi:hypothetical protein